MRSRSRTPTGGRTRAAARGPCAGRRVLLVVLFRVSVRAWSLVAPAATAEAAGIDTVTLDATPDHCVLAVEAARDLGHAALRLGEQGRQLLARRRGPARAHGRRRRARHAGVRLDAAVDVAVV